MTIYSLDVLLFLFGPVCCSMSSSNCCFLTCTQVSQKAGQVVWYSHLFQDFPQFIVIHTVNGFGIVNKAEIDFFLELSCFFDDPVDVGNLISGSSAFSQTILNIWKFTVHILLWQNDLCSFPRQTIQYQGIQGYVGIIHLASHVANSEMLVGTHCLFLLAQVQQALSLLLSVLELGKWCFHVAQTFLDICHHNLAQLCLTLDNSMNYVAHQALMLMRISRQ